MHKLGHSLCETTRNKAAKVGPARDMNVQGRLTPMLSIRRRNYVGVVACLSENAHFNCTQDQEQCDRLWLKDKKDV